jgi:hypothetical protein
MNVIASPTNWIGRGAVMEITVTEHSQHVFRIAADEGH